MKPLCGSVYRACIHVEPPIVGAALAGLKCIYRPGFKMAKAGVMLMQLQSDTVQQHELELGVDVEMESKSQSKFGVVGDENDTPATGRSRLMAAMDDINDRYGRNTMILASAGLAGNQRAWSMKQECCRRPKIDSLGVRTKSWTTWR